MVDDRWLQQQFDKARANYEAQQLRVQQMRDQMYENTSAEELDAFILGEETDV